MPALILALLGFLIGGAVGSFLGAILVRWPENRSIRSGRSFCDACGIQLTWSELIPLVSFIRQGGKCRHCGARIGDDQFRMELYAALIGALGGWLAALIMPAGLSWAAVATGLSTAILGWVLLLLAMLDLRHFWLPDPLNILLAALGVGFALAGIGPSIESRLIAGGVGFASLWLVAKTYEYLRHREGMGGGDPKLFGAIGFWVGWQALPLILLGACATAAVLLLYGLIRQKRASASTPLPLGTLLAAPAFLAWTALVIDSVS